MDAMRIDKVEGAILATLALVVVLAAVVAVVASGNSNDNVAEPPPYTVEQHNPPGNPDVWNRIETGTDCDELQSEWDTAMDNAEARQQQGLHDRLTDLSLDYAAAASKRMRDLGCYG